MVSKYEERKKKKQNFYYEIDFTCNISWITTSMNAEVLGIV